MTTNSQIASMFNEIKAQQKELNDALINPSPRKISTLDTFKNPVEFEPDTRFMMFGLRKKIPDQPNAYLPVTRIMFNRVNNGSIITIDLDGDVESVRRQIATASGFITMETPSPVTRVMHTDLLSDDQVYDVVTERGPEVTDGNGDKWTLGPNGETLKNGENYRGGLGTDYAVKNGNVYVLGTDTPPTWWGLSGPEKAWTSVGTDLNSVN